MAENVVRQRLAAILAADVAGYSRLMGDDERATIDAINSCRAVFREHIEANGGRVVDMAGDSVLAIFDTAIGAFTTAMAAQERVGVNTGDIHEQDDGTVYGDGVNVAARLEALAEPGGICLSDKVHT
jgi:adenylate cyclase